MNNQGARRWRDQYDRILRLGSWWLHLTAAERIALAAVLISLTSLGLSMYTAYLERHHKRLSVRPRVVIWFVYNNTGAGWYVSNDGLGPAAVKWFGVSVDDAPQRNWEAVARLLGLSGTFDFAVFYPTQLLPSGSRAGTLFWAKPGPEKDALVKQNERVRIEICYCSLYDECWLASDRFVGLRGESCDAATIKHPPPFSGDLRGPKGT